MKGIRGLFGLIVLAAIIGGLFGRVGDPENPRGVARQPIAALPPASAVAPVAPPQRQASEAPSQPQAGIAQAAPAISDNQIRDLIIQASLASYSGNCPCPDNRDRAGRRCGARSAYSRPGGASPLCYRSDVSDAQVAQYRRTHGLTGARQAAPAAQQAIQPNLVAQIQQALSNRGYNPGPVDGIMGRRTRAAISQYQANIGLPVTGEPSQALLDDLSAR